MKIKVKDLIERLNNINDNTVVDAVITFDVLEYAESNLKENNFPKKPTLWVHPIFNDLGYKDRAAKAITEAIIDGMKVCKDLGYTRNLPTGIIKFCGPFNNKLSAYFHDYDKADRIINEIINNNKSLWQ